VEKRKLDVIEGKENTFLRKWNHLRGNTGQFASKGCWTSYREEQRDEGNKLLLSLQTREKQPSSLCLSLPFSVSPNKPNKVIATLFAALLLHHARTFPTMFFFFFPPLKYFFYFFFIFFFNFFIFYFLS